jgi:hypothetical protein
MSHLPHGLHPPAEGAHLSMGVFIETTIIFYFQEI